MNPEPCRGPCRVQAIGSPENRGRYSVHLGLKFPLFYNHVGRSDVCIYVGSRSGGRGGRVVLGSGLLPQQQQGTPYCAVPSTSRTRPPHHTVDATVGANAAPARGAGKADVRLLECQRERQRQGRKGGTSVERD